MGVSPEGLQWTKKNIGPGGSWGYPRWEKTTTDMLGRVVSVEVPGYESGVTIQETRAYDDETGKLISTTRSVSPQDASISDAVTYYEYDEMGNIYLSGLDIDEYWGLDLDSTARISEIVREYVKESGIWYAETESATYPINNSYTRLVLSTQRVQLTGLGGSSGALGVLTGKSIQKDEYGNATTTWTYVNRSSKKVTEKTVPPGYGAANHITTTINGYVMSASTTATGALATYKYDGLGRQTYGVDPRIPDQSDCNMTHYNDYNGFGRVDYTTDGAGKQTRYAYDAYTGELISVTDPENKTIHYVYNQRGQKVGEYGATYPVIYCYNDYGEMTDMFTCRTSSGASGLVNTLSEFNTLWEDVVISKNYEYVDRTQWFYHPATGLLTGKRDASGQGPDYTYYKDGELKTREWERYVSGTTTRVKSTYTYDALTRELQSVVYNDGTPSVTYGTRDRLGNVGSITDAQGTRTFTYTNKGALDSETISPIGGGTIEIERKRETSSSYIIGRINGFNLDINNTRTQTLNYSFDNYNRLQGIMFEEYNADTDLVWYDYVPNSDFVDYAVFMTAHYYCPAIMSKRTYETNRDLVHSVENSIIAEYDATPVVINSFTQSYDDAGKLATRSNVELSRFASGSRKRNLLG